MLYQFKCKNHGEFEVRQSILAEHKANCSKCGKEAQRVYSPVKHFWKGNAFRSDGSLREDKDYAPVMK